MRKCEAVGCNWDVFGTDKKTGRGYCKNHQYLRTDVDRYAKVRKPLKRTQIKPKKVKASGLITFYKMIWNERKRSFVSDINLEKTPEHMWLNLFAHVLAKGQNKYPKFKLYKKNVVILTPKEHDLYDNGSTDQREEYARAMMSQGIIVRWERLYELRKELLTEYQKKHGY